MFVLVSRLDVRVRRTESRSIHNFKVDRKAADWQARELFAQVVWIDSRGNHRPENHVAARSGKTIEVKSLHH